MKKRVLSVLAVLVVMGTLCGCGGETESLPETELSAPQIDNTRVNPIEESLPEWEYDEEEDGISVTEYNGNSAVVRIPEEIDGKPVKRIGYLFRVKNNSSVTLEIPACVEYIPYSELGDSLTEIVVDEGNERYFSRDGILYENAYGSTALYSCPQGRRGEVVVPDDTAEIGSYAFGGCKSITAVKIPESVERIRNGAFNGCSSLTSVNIPKAVTKIDGFVFEDCTSLESLEIPETITDISMYAFSGTPFLKKLIEKDPFVVINGILVDGTALKGEVTLPDNIKTIAYGAFSTYDEDNTELKKVILPESFTTIPSGAFSYCEALEEVRLPKGLTEIEAYAFENCSSLKSIEFPDGLEAIGWYAFENCVSLTSVDIPDGVTEVGMSSFRGCENLTQVNVPDSVIDVGLNDCFENCEKVNVTFMGKTYTAAELEQFYAAVAENAKKRSGGETDI